MKFSEREKIRQMAISEERLGHYDKYQQLMSIARNAIPDRISSDRDETIDVAIDGQLFGSTNLKIIERRKQVKKLIELGYNQKTIVQKCHVTISTIRNDIKTLRNLGVI